LEISWRGTEPVSMPDGSERKFIQDGDTVVMRAPYFGRVSGKVLPSWMCCLVWLWRWATKI